MPTVKELKLVLNNFTKQQTKKVEISKFNTILMRLLPKQCIGLLNMKIQYPRIKKFSDTAVGS